MEEEQKAISLSNYANLVVGQQIILFKGGIYIPVAIGWEGDPTILIAKRISELAVETLDSKVAEEEPKEADLDEAA